MKNKIELLVHVDDGGEEDCVLGCIMLPSNNYVEACRKLDLCWDAWRKMVSCNEWEADSVRTCRHFIDWLVKEHGWVKAEGNYHHTFGTQRY